MLPFKHLFFLLPWCLAIVRAVNNKRVAKHHIGATSRSCRHGARDGPNVRGRWSAIITNCRSQYIIPTCKRPSVLKNRYLLIVKFVTYRQEKKTKNITIGRRCAATDVPDNLWCTNSRALERCQPCAHSSACVWTCVRARASALARACVCMYQWYCNIIICFVRRCQRQKRKKGKTSMNIIRIIVRQQLPVSPP